ncbi:MAG: hypothetical protein WB290_09170, partial [Smithella sp.]
VFYIDGVTAVPNCEIKIEDTNGNVISDIQSADGNYSATLQAGDYVINVFLNGANIGTLNITIVAGQNNTANVGTQRSVPN